MSWSCNEQCAIDKKTPRAALGDKTMIATVMVMSVVVAAGSSGQVADSSQGFGCRACRAKRSGKRCVREAFGEPL